MQKVLKSGLVAALVVLSQGLATADDNTEPAEVDSSVISQAGEVNGYLALPVGDTRIDATLINDRLGKSYGKVLILHDSNAGIDSPGLINTLREGLPNSGWTTMTVALTYPTEPGIFLSSNAASMAEPTVDASQASASLPADNATADQDPNTEKKPEPPDNPTRLSAALAYLNSQQTGTTVVLAVGEAARLTDALAEQLGEQRGLIWIRPELELEAMPAIMPILDIAPTVPGSINGLARDRLVFMKQQQATAYDQRRINGAGFRFYGFESRVLSYVRGWLHKQFVSEEPS